MIRSLLLVALLSLTACVRQGPETISEAPLDDATALIATSVPATVTPRPTSTTPPTPTPTLPPSPTRTPTTTPTATPMPNEPPRLISLIAFNVLGKDPVEAVTLFMPAVADDAESDGGQAETASSVNKHVLSGVGPGSPLVVALADRDGNARRALLTSEDGSLSAALDLPRDVVMVPLEGTGEPRYKIHFNRNLVIDISEHVEKELTLTIEDAEGATTSETILLSRHSYNEGDSRPAQLATPWFNALKWEATQEADGLTLDGPLAAWITANPQVAGNLYFVIEGQTPFSWQDSIAQPGLLQERLLLTEDGQPLELHYIGPNLEKQVVARLTAPHYNRFRFVTDVHDPSFIYRVAAPRDDAVSDQDLDNAAAAITRFSRNNPDILPTLVEDDLFFAISPTELTGDTQSTLNGDTIWEDEGMLVDACGLYGYVINRGYLFTREDCLGYEPSYPGGVVVHELGHAVAFHMLREHYPNLAVELAEYNIEPPFQWPSVEEELKWGNETWAHAVEAWFGVDTKFWWFWETDRPGTGRLFDVIELQDGRSLRRFMFDLFGPPQDINGKEYPQLADAAQ